MEECNGYVIVDKDIGLTSNVFHEIKDIQKYIDDRVNDGMDVNQL